MENHGKPWKMKKYNPGLEKSWKMKMWQKVMEFCIFISAYPITFEKMVLITYNFDTQ